VAAINPLGRRISGANPRKEREHMGLFGTKEIDPVCKMKVDPKTAQWKSEWQGKTYYFCSPGCKDKFAAQPAKYLPGPP
jgi:YHS domain-containing protein